MFDNTFLNRVLFKSLCAVVLPLCALWGAVATWTRPASASAQVAQGFELPAQWEGRPLRPIALGEVEQRFARQFPGTLARMTDGRAVLVLRTVNRPTRMLHPAADCYRGLGYRVARQRLQRDTRQAMWRCFEAARGAQHLQVCERIVDAHGAAFTDTSAWFWAAALGHSQGPWQAVTVASPL